MAIDWGWIEELVVKHAEKQLAAFADANQDKTFYGAIFAIEPFDGVAVSILLNTREFLIGDVGEAAANDYQWLAGAFGYSIDVSAAIDAWSEIDDSIVEATEADMTKSMLRDDGLWRTSGDFVDAVCRAALRLEHAGAFAPLHRTADFAVIVTPDPSEPAEVSRDRLAAFRT